MAKTDGKLSCLQVERSADKLGLTKEALESFRSEYEAMKGEEGDTGPAGASGREASVGRQQGDARPPSASDDSPSTSRQGLLYQLPCSRPLGSQISRPWLSWKLGAVGGEGDSSVGACLISLSKP